MMLRIAYNPDQPRVPKGDDQGGEWTAIGAGTRSFTDAELTAKLQLAAAAAELAKWSSYNPDAPPFLDVSQMSVADRVAILEQIVNKQATFYLPKYGSEEYHQWDALRDKAKKENWTPEQFLAEAKANGFLSSENKGYNSTLGNRTDLTDGTFWKGLTANSQRDALETGYVKALSGETSAFDHAFVTTLVDNGWTHAELERFADKVQAAGGTYARWATDEPEGVTKTYRTLDSTAGSLYLFSKDYENFRATTFAGWAVVHGSSTAVTIRAIAEEVWPAPDGQSFYKLPEKEFDRQRLEPYSPRAVENLKALKRETEQFYKKKLGQDLEIYRGIAGHIDAYAPASVESWTTDPKTVDRFGKLMTNSATHKGAYSGLTTKIKYDDILWSWQSAKGKPGWPPDSQLKGKKEVVPIGNRIISVVVDKRWDETQTRRSYY